MARRGGGDAEIDVDRMLSRTHARARGPILGSIWQRREMTDSRCQIPLHYSRAQLDAQIYIDYGSLRPVEHGGGRAGEEAGPKCERPGGWKGRGRTNFRHSSPVGAEMCADTHAAD